MKCSRQAGAVRKVIARAFIATPYSRLNLGQAATATNDEYKGSQSQESFYGRVIYNYNNRYSFTATIRKRQVI